MNTKKILLLIATIILGGCLSDGKKGKDGKDGKDGPDGNSPPAYYTISGNASGIILPGITLQNNAGDDLIVDSNGSFFFATTIIDGGVYDVTILTVPDHQICNVANGSGDVTANVSDIRIACAHAQHISGTVTGITGSGITLQNNGGDDLIIAADGRFTFPSLVLVGETYAVSILSSPGDPAQDCSISRASGAAIDHVIDVAIDCIVNSDDIADAFDLTPGVEVRFSDIGGTLESGEVHCGESTDSTLWFNFTAANDGRFVAYATGSDHDTIFSWSESLTGPVGECTDDSKDSYDAVGEMLTFAADEKKYVQIGNYGTRRANPATGTGSVGVTAVVDAADDFAEATTLALAAGAPTAVIGIEFFGDETPDVVDGLDECGSTTMGAGSVWVNFVAPNTGTWMIEAKSHHKTDIAVYSGSSLGSLTLLNCATNHRRAVLVDLTAEEAYTIRIAQDQNQRDVVAVRAEQVSSTMTATLVDGDNRNVDGNPINVGEYSDMAIVNKQPAIAYIDTISGTVRYAERIDGVWSHSDIGVSDEDTVVLTEVNGNPAIVYEDYDSDALYYAERVGGVWERGVIVLGGYFDEDIDEWVSIPGVFDWASIIVMANGEPAVSYQDKYTASLGFAERIGGKWAITDIDIRDRSVGHYPGQYTSLAQFDNGDLGISYVVSNRDADRYELHFARRTGDLWSKELVYEMRQAVGFERPDLLAGTSLVIDSTDSPIISTNDAVEGRHLLFSWNGASWDVEQDYADRNLAQSDEYATLSKLLIGSDDTLYLVWVDSGGSGGDSISGAGSVAMSVRDPAGNWTAQDLVPYFIDPNDPEYAGTNTVWSTLQLGAVLLPDGRLGVSIQLSSHDTLWYIEGKL